ncbi:hypothetical protein ACEWY4_024885 [Coilia grayii]|uniref:Sterile alpha motif domain-containing protein 9-like n=1 Tax=Coilia grayii TaxID=363190 RepID=A0ABD1IXU1_9TELE
MKMANSSSLNILQPDQFEGEEFDEEDARHIQANYYKGAPPQWVNFHLAEKNRLPFVKRYGYEDTKSLILEANRRRRKIVSMVNLLHQPGRGGSTLAMQVLWDLRKQFWCAKLKDAITDQNVIVQDVIKLTNRKKPVLLLLDNVDMQRENLAKKLKRSLIDELNNNSNSTMPVIILNCARKAEFADQDLQNTVVLNANMEEIDAFRQHHRTVTTDQFQDLEHEMFHGLNIISGGFDPKYTANICEGIVPPKINHRPRRDQLFAILALISKFAPGSDLLLDQCSEFLQKNPYCSDRTPSFEEQMGYFSKLLVRYTNFEKNVEYVRIAHPNIATTCVEIFTHYGVRMSAVTSLFLEFFCAVVESPHLMQMAKTILTMRETNGQNEEKDKFSKLIEHIYKKEGKEMCTKLLKQASRVFKDRPTFPQTLARCYYLMVNKREPIRESHYIKAETFAREAIRRHCDNSFIMDTLGQVHKHHLIHRAKGEYTHSDMLHLGSLALDAFQKEEEAAEKEEADENVTDGTANIAPFFNSRGKLGYLQVAQQLFESLVRVNRDWRDVLTCSRNISKSLDVPVTRKQCRLIRSLQAEVKQRFEFFEEYLTYSQFGPGKDDPAYIREYAIKCYAHYVGTPPKVLKMKFEDANEAGMDKLEEDEITTLTDLQEFLERHSSEHSPESYHLALLQSPGDQDLSDVVMKMKKAYENTYEKYFHSRHLVPLYMKSANGWQTLSELSLQPWQIEKGAKNDPNGTEEGAVPDQRIINERLNNLVRIQGAFERPNVFALLNNDRIEVQRHSKDTFFRNGPIFFYLGFTIKGPVAFNIRYES